MAETTTEVRADIEQTKARISGAIAELERKVDIAQRVRDHPWTAVGVAFGAGIALSATRADARAAVATKESGSKLGGALDGVLAAVIAGVAGAFQSRIDGMVRDVVTGIKGDEKPRWASSTERESEPPLRAD